MTPAPHKDPRARAIARLFAEAKKRGIDSDQLRNEIAPGVIGKRLSKASPFEVCLVLRHIGAAPTPPPPDGERRTLAGFKERYDELGFRSGFATPAQLRMIEAMWMDASRMPNRAAKEKALQGFLRRIVKVDDMRFIEVWMVQKIVNAVKSMKRSPS